mgnify:CR=1 FL=1
MVQSKKRALVPLPGGCEIGSRPIDMHIDVIKKSLKIFDKLIVATNQNDILQRVINTGEYKPDKVLSLIHI